MSFTTRGFAVYDQFPDMYGNEITVQESSNVDGGIWLFCKNGTNPDPSPHLNRTQAERLIVALRAALDRQTFAENDAPTEAADGNG